MTEKKITITLEDYSKAVEAVIEQMTLSMTSGLLIRVVSGIVSQVSCAIWDRMVRTSEIDGFVDNVGKIVDQIIEERSGKGDDE